MTFPSAPGGLPERMIHHDLMHVIDGDDTDPAGECELGGFYAACAGAIRSRSSSRSSRRSGSGSP
jgi:hypothetical protein